MNTYTCEFDVYIFVEIYVHVLNVSSENYSCTCMSL